MSEHKPATEMHWGVAAKAVKSVTPTEPGTIYQINNGPWKIIGPDGKPRNYKKDKTA